MEWLTEGETSTNTLVGDYTNVEELITNLPEAELARLDGTVEMERATTSEFKTASEGELNRLIENNFNANTKRSTSTWLKQYEKWVEHKGEQTDMACVAKENLDGISYPFSYIKNNYMINRQSHTFSSNLGNNCTRNKENHTRLRLVQFYYCLVQLFPKSDSNVCDYIYLSQVLFRAFSRNKQMKMEMYYVL